MHNALRSLIEQPVFSSQHSAVHSGFEDNNPDSIRKPKCSCNPRAFKRCTCHGAKLFFEQGQHLESACIEIVALNFAVSFPCPVLSHDASRQQSINANHKWRRVGQLYQQNKSHPYGILNFKSSDGFFCLIILLPDHQFCVDLQKTNHTFLRIWMKIGIHAHWPFWGHGNLIEHL